MTDTIHDRPTTDDRPRASEGDQPEQGRGKRKLRLRDMYWERKDGPVTMAERWRAAVVDLIVIPLFFGVVTGIQVWGRGREVDGGWLVGAGIVTVLFAGLGFAFPRFSPGGWAHLHNTDWSKESKGSKVLAIIAMLVLIVVMVARAVHRMD